MEGVNPEQGWKLGFDSRGLSLNPTDPLKSGVGRFKPKAEPTWPSKHASRFQTAPVGSAREKHAGLTRPTPDPASYALNLRTTAIGRADALSPVAGATPVVRDNRVELSHAQATEWYVNTALGLEHGFTFEHAPQGERGEVRIQLAVEGGLKARPDAGGVMLTDESGARRMRYHKLLVLDANQRALDARMSIAADHRIEIAFDDTQAMYPVVVDPLLVNQEAKLTASDGAAGDVLGFEVALSGNTLVVTAGGDDIGSNTNQGSVYVFVRSGTTWSQQAKLVADDGEGLDLFGVSDAFGTDVGISGDTVVVGARADNVGSNLDQGAAYIFVRSGTTWAQQAKLLADDGSEHDQFGWNVGISGDTVVVGATFDDVDGIVDAGSAYVFERSGTSWTQQARLVATDRADFDGFGGSVSISGDTVGVGAGGDDIGGNADQGSAYIFVGSGTNWSQQGKLVAADGGAGDNFYVVSVSGDTALVGALRADNGGNTNQGSAYVFARSGESWSQQAKLVAADGATDDLFGQNVAISADTAVVGSHGADIGGNDLQGSAYVFILSGAGWSQQAKLLADDGAAVDIFGYAVSVDGDTVAVGAPVDDIDGNLDQGSAYVYRIAAPTETVASITLTPETATKSVLTQHCVTATTLNAAGAAVPAIPLGFTVTGVNLTTGSATTDGTGDATFCFIGVNAGNDLITASFMTRSGTASVVWTKRETALQVDPVVAAIVTQGLQIRILIKPTATLRDTQTHLPIVGRTVNFAAGTTALCSAVTNAQGVARCQANVGNTLRGALGAGYTGRFNGDTTYNPSSGMGPVLGLTLF
ncbi:MAG: hypothetical protein ACT4QA_06325 [Panacagrimonas sp.]